MRARLDLVGRPVLWAAAVLVLFGLTEVKAAEDDSFFTNLDGLDSGSASLGGVPDQPATLATLPASPKSSTNSAPETSPTPLAPAVASTPSVAPSKAVPSAGPPNVHALLEKGLKPEDTTGALGPERTLKPLGWAPDHAGDVAVSGSPAKADSFDPEPDDAIKVPAGNPSKDPLDKAAPAAESVAQPADPLPPLPAALKAALDKRNAAAIRGTGAGERRKEREAISFFYAAHGFAPIWSKDGKAVDAVASVLSRLAHADEDALSIASPPKQLVAQGSNEDIAESELALTEAVIAYARQATGSRIDPKTINALIGERPELADPAEVLDLLLAAGPNAGDKLQALNPREPRYAALREKLGELRHGHVPNSQKAFPAGPTLRVGMHDARVPMLRKRFGLDLGFEDQSNDLTYDIEVSDAVSDFQRANGLPTTGTLTKRTVAALSGGSGKSGSGGKPSRLEGTLIANMEMWRWMPHDLGADRIEVNVPDYLVTVFHDGTSVDQHRVVVGKTDTPTPIFSNTMKYLIVNPYWNVPQSIIKKELLPKGGGDLSYLEDRGYTVSWHGGQAVVKQLPGDKNALGRIKFLFPNDYSVYLHDTPSKPLFSSTKRAFSHGCVRVDKPFAFAETVLNAVVPADGHKRWSEERLKGMIGDKERYLNLPLPLPIHIEYFTASVDGGQVKLREDVYGYTHAVAAALGQDSEPVPVAERKPPVAERKPPRPREIAQRLLRKVVVESEPVNPVDSVDPVDPFDPR